MCDTSNRIAIKINGGSKSVVGDDSYNVGCLPIMDVLFENLL